MGAQMMSPGVQIVNMRPPQNAQNQQKTLTNVPQRVLIGGPTMVGTRPQNSAVRLTIQMD